MNKAIIRRRTGRLAAIALGTCLAAHVAATPLAANPIAAAVRHGNCEAAVDLINNGATAKDGQSAYVVGRMLDEGICVRQNIEAAARFFAQGSDLGDSASSLEYGAKVGLGEGTEQSYDRAGEICRHAGLDPQVRMSAYSLGYACTVRGVAGRLLRERLPPDAFRPGGALRVAFNPASLDMSIEETPRVARETDASTGTMVRRALVDARHEIEEAWQNALGMVPKPDAKRLASQPIDLSLDVDMTLEIRRQSSAPQKRNLDLRSLMPGELGPSGIGR
jgi:TPR repeat protein